MRKMLLAIVFVVLGGAGMGIYFDFFSQETFEFIKASLMETKEREPEKEPEEWMTVFVHGSFGSLLSIISAYQVIQDDVNGTMYKKIVNKIRKEPFFYRDQPLLEKGLVRVEPSFDLAATKNKKIAAYPLIKAYELINEHVWPKKEKNYFYTFGWSGLVSQKRRRLEAIRFYNALREELETYHARGIYPKIRIFSHSHGGNVVAYLAAVDQVVRLHGACAGKQCMFDSIEQDDQKEVLQSLYKELGALQKKEKVKALKGQKVFDYWPVDDRLVVEEVFLWGMPVQPETDHFFLSPFFERVFNCYSDDDLVQRADFFSTKKGYSDRRFKRALSGDKSSKIVQVRIVVDRKFKKKPETHVPETHVSATHVSATHVSATHSCATQVSKTQAVKSEEKQESIWSILFSGGAIVTPVSKDPTHKELWFFSWHEKAQGRKFVLAPFPAVVFSPLLAKLVESKDNLHDVDINISSSQDRITFELAKRGEEELQSEFCLQERFLEPMRKKVEPWRTKSVSSRDVFAIIRKSFDSF